MGSTAGTSNAVVLEGLPASSLSGPPVRSSDLQVQHDSPKDSVKIVVTFRAIASTSEPESWWLGHIRDLALRCDHVITESARKVAST